MSVRYRDQFRIIPRGFGGIRTTSSRMDTSFQFDRLYREDLAVSGQLIVVTVRYCWIEIIPRGFGGIRTTTLGYLTCLDIELIIPRGFGGIRTTRQNPDYSSTRVEIIPRGFGGIRTTALVTSSNSPSSAIGLYREDLAVSGQHTFDLWRRTPGEEDYTERIWRYQDNIQMERQQIIREDLAVRTTMSNFQWTQTIIPRGFGGIRTTEVQLVIPVGLDYTERIWRYQDNLIQGGCLACSIRDYTERIWRYQDNYLKSMFRRHLT